MSFIDKMHAIIEFCREHPGEAFDEGEYEKREREKEQIQPPIDNADHELL